MRLGKVDHARIRDLEDRLGHLDLSRPRTLDDILPAVGELLGAPRHHVAYTARVNDHGLYVDRMWGPRLGHPAALRALNRLLSDRPRSWTTYDLYAPDPSERNIAVDSARKNGWDAIRATAFYQEVGVPNGLANHDQLRVLICEEKTLLAFVGVWRHDALFTERERQLLQRITPALRRRLVLERNLLDGPDLRAGLDAALEAISGEAFVVSRYGEVCEANQAGRARLERDRLRTREALREAVRGGGSPFGVTWLSTGGALLVRRLTDAREARVQTAARERKLTSRQTEVLRQLAFGKSNKEIAAVLGCSPETIEVHLRALCEKFDCESRAGILARLLEL